MEDDWIIKCLNVGKVEAVFDRNDADGDGVLSKQEFQQLVSGSGKKKK